MCGRRPFLSAAADVGLAAWARYLLRHVVFIGCANPHGMLDVCTFG